MTLEKKYQVERNRELWEICIAYVVVNFGRTREGGVFSNLQREDIIGYWWKVFPDKTVAAILTRLANPAEKDTKKIRAVVSDYGEVLKAGANMVVEGWEVGKRGLAPRV